MLKLNDNKLKIPTIASGLDKCKWPIIKQIIFNEFQNSNIKIIICHKQGSTNITNNWKTYEHEQLLHVTHAFKENKFMDETIKTHLNDKVNTDIQNIFKNFKPGENVQGDGNCGIHALFNALNDGQENKINSISNILEILGLQKLPSYWWADDELASLANHFRHDTYIFNDTDKTAIIYKNNNDKDRPSIVLYNTNNNTHWIPGTKSTKPPSKIPINYSIFDQIIPLQTIINKINKHITTSNILIDNTNTNTTYIDNKNNCNLGPKKENEKCDIHFNINKVIKPTTGSKQTIADSEGTHLNISDNLSLEQHKQVVNLLQEFIHLFTTDTSKVKPANIKPCEIKLKPNFKDPKFNAPHRISPQQRDELKIQLNKLLDANIIRPIISKFAAPAFLVKKKEKGSYNLVFSYIDLNERVKTDQYPIPRTADLLRALEGLLT